MSRILLADDSPHAQRMGERILREEGFEVVTVTDGETALIRLEDVDPDVVLADVFLPLHSGFEICQYVKSQPRFRHARVVLLAGLLEPVDEAAVSRVGADGVLKKPFEASAMVAAIRPLAEAAQAAREEVPLASHAPSAPAATAEVETAAKPDAAEATVAVATAPPPAPAPEPTPEPVETAAEVPEEPPVALETTEETSPAIDEERVRAAVTIALDRAMPAMIDEITEWVLAALGQ
jgi:CheY-like chemotaxis protein